MTTLQVQTLKKIQEKLLRLSPHLPVLQEALKLQNLLEKALEEAWELSVQKEINQTRLEALHREGIPWIHSSEKFFTFTEKEYLLFWARLLLQDLQSQPGYFELKRPLENWFFSCQRDQELKLHRHSLRQVMFSYLAEKCEDIWDIFWWSISQSRSQESFHGLDREFLRIPLQEVARNIGKNILHVACSELSSALQKALLERERSPEDGLQKYWLQLQGEILDISCSPESNWESEPELSWGLEILNIYLKEGHFLKVLIPLEPEEGSTKPQKMAHLKIPSKYLAPLTLMVLPRPYFSMLENNQLFYKNSTSYPQTEMTRALRYLTQQQQNFQKSSQREQRHVKLHMTPGLQPGQGVNLAINRPILEAFLTLLEEAILHKNRPSQQILRALYKLPISEEWAVLTFQQFIEKWSLTEEPMPPLLDPPYPGFYDSLAIHHRTIMLTLVQSLVLSRFSFFSLPMRMDANKRFHLSSSLLNYQGSTIQRLFLCFGTRKEEMPPPPRPSLVAIQNDLTEILTANLGELWTADFRRQVRHLDWRDPLPFLNLLGGQLGLVVPLKRSKILLNLTYLLEWSHSFTPSYRPSPLIAHCDAIASIFQILSVETRDSRLGRFVGLAAAEADRGCPKIYALLVEKLYLLLEEFQTIPAREILLQLKDRLPAFLRGSALSFRESWSDIELSDLDISPSEGWPSDLLLLLSKHRTLVPEPLRYSTNAGAIYLLSLLRLLKHRGEAHWSQMRPAVQKYSKDLLMKGLYGSQKGARIRRLHKEMAREIFLLGQLDNSSWFRLKNRLQDFALLDDLLVYLLHLEVPQWRFFRSLTQTCAERAVCLEWKTSSFSWTLDLRSQREKNLRLPGFRLKKKIAGLATSENLIEGRSYAKRSLAAHLAQNVDSWILLEVFQLLQKKSLALVPIHDSMGVLPGYFEPLRNIWWAVLRKLQKERILWAFFRQNLPPAELQKGLAILGFDPEKRPPFETVDPRKGLAP